MIFRTLAFIAWLLVGVSAEAYSNNASPLKIQAQSYTHDPESDVYTYKNARLEWGSINFSGGEILYYKKAGLIEAKEFVRYSDAQVIAVVDHLKLDITTKRGTLYDVVLFDSQSHTYLKAKTVERIGEHRFIATDCIITTCSPQNPTWKIKGSKIDYEAEHFSSAVGTKLYIHEIPVFYFPYLIWPTITKRQSGFLPPAYKIYSSNAKKRNLDLGWKVDVPYFLELNTDHDLTINAELIEKRGVGTGWDYQYAFRDGLRGELKLWQIQEVFSRGKVESDTPDKFSDDEADRRHQRFQLKWNHSQQFDSRTHFILSGAVYSDAQYQREYERVLSPNPNYSNHLRASLSRQFETGNTSIIFNREQVFERQFLLDRGIVETRVQRLPEISFHFSGTPWTPSLTFEIEGTATRFHRDAGFIGTREIVTPKIRYRHILFDHITTLFSVGKRFSFYQVYNPGEAVIFRNSNARYQLSKQSLSQLRKEVQSRDLDVDVNVLEDHIGSTYTASELEAVLKDHLGEEQANEIIAATKNVSEIHEEAIGKREAKNFSYGVNLFEAEMNTTFSKIWETDQLLFSRFKHLMTPRVILESVADVNQDATRRVRFDRISKGNGGTHDFFDHDDLLPGKRLLVFRLDNILLAKRRLWDRSVQLSKRSLTRLRSKLTHRMIRKLERLVGKEFHSELIFLESLDELFGPSITQEQKDLILFYVEKGVVNRKTNSTYTEGPSWALARFNIIQRYNLLRLDKNYDPNGPVIEEQETDPGNPLLPLIIDWSLNPGPQFSVDFFVRYHHQDARVVESKSTFNVQVSPNNQAQISFHNNEDAYRTPDNIFHERTSTLGFGNVFEANEQLSFGFEGQLNLSRENPFKRRLMRSGFFVDYHPGCYVVSLHFEELADAIEQNVSERAIMLNISLGQVLLPSVKID